MIIVDTSAIIAMILEEPNYQSFAAKMLMDDVRAISPVTLLEATMVLSRAYSEPRTALDPFLRRANITVCTVDAAHAEFAQEAFLKFGKGRHPARLNFGDCFSYAAAKALNAPLLYVGDDFAKTDIRAA
jgi:ribonuclease VapC